MGGREAGGVGGLLRLFCCTRLKNRKSATEHKLKTCLVLALDNVTHSQMLTPRGSADKQRLLILKYVIKYIKVSTRKETMLCFSSINDIIGETVYMRSTHY